MSEAQHVEAHRLLPLLAKTVAANRLLTYATAARELGRNPKRNARMVAQVCDLLDAAAAAAGVPLLALIAVREASGDINRRAWKDVPAEVRQEIITRSLRHSFVSEDFAAIGRALSAFQGLGNRAAWKRVRQGKTAVELAHQILQNNSPPEFDAINDIGTDLPYQSVVTTLRYTRDPRIRAAVIDRAGGKCEFCGRTGFLCSSGTPYLESHHIIALAADGADRMTNVIALCPNDHREAHFGQKQNEIENEMIRIVRSLQKDN